MIQDVDLVIAGGALITMDPSRRIIRDAGIAVDNGSIVAVGQQTEISSQFVGRETINASRRVISPGFVNGHIHFWHQMHRGMAPDSFYGPQWSNFVYKNFVPVLTEEDEVWAAYLVLLELMKTGTTSFLAAGSYYPDAVMEAIGAVGLRGFEGRRTNDAANFGLGPPPDDTHSAIRANAAVMETHSGNGATGLVQPCVNIAGLGLCTDELLVASKELADQHGAILNLHQCAFPEEVASIVERSGSTPVEHLHRLGVLGPNVVLVHMIHVTEREIDLLASTGTNVVYCPGTALKLVYGLSRSGRFPEMAERGVNIALGTDSGDCANWMDMVRAMHLAALLFKDIRYDPTVMGAELALEMATTNGSRALGLGDSVGSIEVGKRADIVLFNSDRPEWQPLFCEPYNMVYSASGSSADTVIVDGRIVMKGGKVLTIDEAEVVHRIRALGRGILHRSGVRPPTRWPIVGG